MLENLEISKQVEKRLVNRPLPVMEKLLNKQLSFSPERYEVIMNTFFLVDFA